MPRCDTCRFFYINLTIDRVVHLKKAAII
ncbi:MAG: hypothetical protein ACI8R1_002398, partial [Psychrobacter glaciei]